jgi:hypothetical protein
MNRLVPTFGARSFLCAFTATAAFVATPRAVLAQTVDHLTAGFTSPADYQLNGNARAAGSSITLTDSTGGGQHGSLFTLGKVNVSQFSTTFQFQLLPNSGTTYGDGITFTIQNGSPQALGGTGSDLGYGGITNSLAIKFDTYLSSANGVSDPSANSTGIFTGGQSPVGGNDLSCCVTLRSHYMNALIEYDGSTLTLTLADYTTATYYVWNWSNIDIPTLMGGSRTAYVGFTGGSGASFGTQQIFNWIYRSISPLSAVEVGLLSVSSCSTPSQPVIPGVVGNALNDLGQAVGQTNACVNTTPAALTQHAFLWDVVHQNQDLSTPNGNGWGISAANAINSHGTVAGDTYQTVFDGESPAQKEYIQTGFTWTASGGMSVLRGPTYGLSCAPWEPIGWPCSPGQFSFLRMLGINTSGKTTGWMEVVPANGPLANVTYDSTAGNGVAPTPFSGSPPYSRAYAINDYGLAVGDENNGANCALFDTTTNMQHNVSSGTSNNQTLLSVNSSGQAVGFRDSTAILWIPSSANGTTGSFIDLVTGQFAPASRANGINDAGFIIETILNEPNVRIPSTAGVRSGLQVSLEGMNTDGMITDQQGRTLTSQGVRLTDGRAVNNLGQYLVSGTTGGGDQHAYLLSPKITPVLGTPSPASVTAGHAAFTLTLNGSNFMYGAEVLFNGSVRTSTVVSPTQMQVSILASDVATRGNYVITVVDPVLASPAATKSFSVN